MLRQTLLVGSILVLPAAASLAQGGQRGAPQPGPEVKRRKVYTHDSFTSAGLLISSTGTVEGDTWTWTGADGRSRHIIKVLSPATFSFRTELSQDGRTWVTLTEGTASKTD